MDTAKRTIDIRTVWRFLATWAMPAAIFLTACSLCFTAIRLSSLFSIALWVILVVGPIALLVHWIRSFRKGFGGQDMADVVIVLLSALFAFLSAWIGSRELTLTYLRKVVFFVDGICFLVLARSLKLTRREGLAYGYGSLLAIAVFLVVFLFRIGTTFVGNGATKSLVLNFPNANGLGLSLFYTIIGLFFLVAESKAKIIKIGALLSTVAAYLLLYLTRSRNFLFAGILVLLGAVVLFLVRNSVRGKTGTKLLFLAFVFSPLLLVVCYYFLVWIQFPNFFVDGIAVSSGSSGKSILNRVDIWIRALKLFDASPCLGSYFDATEGLGVSQLHNVHLDVLSAFGICGYLIFGVASFRAYRSARCTGRSLSLMQFLCLGALIGVEFSMFFEGGHLNSPISEFLIIIPLALLKGDKNPRFATFEKSEILARELPWTIFNV